MDPTAAFSLLCGIMQVVEFSAKVVKKCRELYRDGVSSEYKEAEEMANNLTNLRAKLDFPDESAGKDLLDLGSKFSDTAEELIAELEKLKVDGPHRKRQVARKTFKIMLKGSPIDRIQKRLDEHRKHLDSKILVDLRFVHRDNLLHFCISVCASPWHCIYFSVKRPAIVYNMLRLGHNWKTLRLVQAF